VHSYWRGDNSYATALLKGFSTGWETGREQTEEGDDAVRRIAF
jgi:hypothetical protein